MLSNSYAYMRESEGVCRVGHTCKRICAYMRIYCLIFTLYVEIRHYSRLYSPRKLRLHSPHLFEPL
jgi:hypothetical protein